MKKMCNIYEATNLAGEVVARGFAADVCIVLGVGLKSLSILAKQKNLIKGKYRVKVIGQKYKYYDPEYKKTVWAKKPLPITKSAEEEIFDDQLLNLKIHGNTVVSGNPEKYLRIFREYGLECAYETIKRKKEKPYYIFSVKGATI